MYRVQVVGEMPVLERKLQHGHFLRGGEIAGLQGRFRVLSRIPPSVLSIRYAQIPCGSEVFNFAD